MSNEVAVNWPGQVERIDFSLEHVKCLASVPRSEVFWSISMSVAESVAEIAAKLDRPANTTTYHVNELVQAGLVLCVGERKVKTRVEKLYVRSALSFFYQAAGSSHEYRELYIAGFLNLLRTTGREMEALNDLYSYEPEISQFRMVRRFSFRITPSRSVQFKKELAELMQRYAIVEDPDGVRINAVTFISPTLAESRRRLRKHKHTP